MKNIEKSALQKLTLLVKAGNYNISFLNALWYRMQSFQLLQTLNLKLEIPKNDDDLNYEVIAKSFASLRLMENFTFHLLGVKIDNQGFAMLCEGIAYMHCLNELNFRIDLATMKFTKTNFKHLSKAL